jgi:hypothetical protein
MPQRTRMLRIWLALAGSMTCGTLLLSWLERSHPVPQQAISLDVLQQQVRAVVSDHRDRLQPWQGVVLRRVDPQPPLLALAATKPQDDVHFLLRTTGHMESQTPWQRQRILHRDGWIHVGIEAPARSTIDPDRLALLRHLVDELSRAVGGETPLPIGHPARTGQATDEQTFEASLVDRLHTALASL